MMRIQRTWAMGLALWACLTVPGLAQDDKQAELQRYAETGQKALTAGDYTAARDNFERAAKLEPSIAEVHATLAAIYFKQREYDLAVSEARTAQKLKPSLPRLDSLLGLSLAELGRYSDALPRLEKGFKQMADAEVRRMCGLQLLRAYTGLHRDGDAVETALSLNKTYPDDPEVLYHTGKIYGNYAYVVMEKLHDKAPDSVWMLQAQGEANESQKDYDAAVIAYNHVLALDPHRPGIHYRVGRVYLRRYQETRRPEDRDTAKREFDAELQTDPANGNAAYELAQMAADDNQLDEARKRFEDLTTHFPDFEQALVGLGGVYLQSQSGAEAVSTLQRAAKIDPNDEVAWYRLALAERAAGHRDEAQRALDKFRKLHQDSTAAQRRSSVEEITAQKLGADAPQ